MAEFSYASPGGRYIEGAPRFGTLSEKKDRDMKVRRLTSRIILLASFGWRHLFDPAKMSPKADTTKFSFPFLLYLWYRLLEGDFSCSQTCSLPQLCVWHPCNHLFPFLCCPLHQRWKFKQVERVCLHKSVPVTEKDTIPSVLILPCLLLVLLTLTDSPPLLTAITMYHMRK